jgi:hypothetical protein
VALAVALHIAIDEERGFEAEAETLEQRLELRLDRIEAQLAGLDPLLTAGSPASTPLRKTIDHERTAEHEK